MSRLLRAPVLHMVLLGLALFAADRLLGEGAGRQRLVVAQHRVDRSLAVLAQDLGRPPTEAERRQVIDALVNQEVLFDHAMKLGMYRQPVVQRRLAQIADFVSVKPAKAETLEARAKAALDLGLYKGDLLVRRILADSARRLIRAAVLIRRPSEAMLAEFLAAYPDAFRLPGTTRITQVCVNAFKYGGGTAARAAAVLERIRRDRLTPAVAASLEPQIFLPASLPALTDKDLATRLGQGFAKALAAAPVGRWSGPLPSRYGLNLVYVHERVPPRVPSLAEIHDKVEHRLKQKLADEWLAVRERQLRAGYDIVVGGQEVR